MSQFATGCQGYVGVRDIREDLERSAPPAQVPVNQCLKSSVQPTPLEEHQLPLILVQGGEGIQRGQSHRQHLDGPPQGIPKSAEESLLTHRP